MLRLRPPSTSAGLAAGLLTASSSLLPHAMSSSLGPQSLQAVMAELCATMIFVAMGTASVVFTSDAANMNGILLSANLTSGGLGSNGLHVVGNSFGINADLSSGAYSLHGTDNLQGGGIDAALQIQYSLPRWLNISFCFGLMIGVLVFSTGSISGGNINPAVTISLAMIQKMSSFRATCYVAAQCLGAVLGAALIKSLAPDLYDAAGGAANAINWSNPYISIWTVVGSEMLGTALLVFTVCAAADVGREKNNKYQGALTPFIIGFAVLIAHLFLIPIDGCSINPARTFGTAVVSGRFADHWLFWLSPIIGGTSAALLYENLFRLYPAAVATSSSVKAPSSSAASGALDRQTSGGSMEGVGIPMDGTGSNLASPRFDATISPHFQGQGRSISGESQLTSISEAGLINGGSGLDSDRSMSQHDPNNGHHNPSPLANAGGAVSSRHNRVQTALNPLRQNVSTIDPNAEVDLASAYNLSAASGLGMSTPGGSSGAKAAGVQEYR